MLLGTSGGVAAIAAVSGATAMATLCCVSAQPVPEVAPEAGAVGSMPEQPTDVSPPLRSSPTRAPHDEGSDVDLQTGANRDERQRCRAKSSDAAAADTPDEPGLAFYGAGFAWDDPEAKPLEDAASQMFSLCLKWRAAGETLNAFKLNKLEFILSRQTRGADLPDEAISRQRFTASLLVDLLDSWVASDTRGPPQAAAARKDKANALAVALRAAYTVEHAVIDVCATQEGWRHSHAGAYVQWLEREMCTAESRKLAVSPLKHILLHYDRSLLIAGGLWLEFGVAEGATLGLIARHIPSYLADGVVVGSGKSAGKCFGFDSFTGLPQAWRPGFVRRFTLAVTLAPPRRWLPADALKRLIVCPRYRRAIRTLGTFGEREASRLRFLQR
jgi:hypothetical protein